MWRFWLRHYHTRFTERRWRRFMETVARSQDIHDPFRHIADREVDEQFDVMVWQALWRYRWEWRLRFVSRLVRVVYRHLKIRAQRLQARIAYRLRRVRWWVERKEDLEKQAEAEKPNAYSLDSLAKNAIQARAPGFKSEGESGDGVSS